ncbi:MAG: integration host factor subunit alpha [Desulfobacteraceae bacterium]|nr:integration host factor subunit alpha [Desulfobacteraceae bacterium]
MALTKAQIVETVQKEIGLPKKSSTELIEDLLEIIKRTLEAGEDVLISGFGKFCVKQKRARRGRNPATGDDLMLSPRRVLTFKCSGKLRKRINS